VRCCRELPDRGGVLSGGQLAGMAVDESTASSAGASLILPCRRRSFASFRHRPQIADVFMLSSLAPLRPCEGVMYLHEAQLLLRIEAEAERRYSRVSRPRRGCESANDHDQPRLGEICMRKRRARVFLRIVAGNEGSVAAPPIDWPTAQAGRGRGHGDGSM